MVDTYIAGQTAKAGAYTADVASEIGGVEKLNEAIKWATEGGMTPAEIEAYNKLIDEGDLSKAKMAVAGLAAKHKAAVGVKPQLVQGKTNTPAAASGYRSVAEMTAAMKDPRYAKDPAYRADVEKRVAASQF